MKDCFLTDRNKRLVIDLKAELVDATVIQRPAIIETLRKVFGEIL